MLKYFKGSFLSLVLGLLLSGYIGFVYSQSTLGIINAVWIAFVLAILEISLSFDNAIVNAVILKEMNSVWRHRFLTWGMLIAVFGMRLVFPLAIVSIVGHISPLEAIKLAAFSPDEYAAMMLSSHLSVVAFGGSFLLMVCLKYFFDENKDEHWIGIIERPLIKLGKMEAIEAAIALVILLILRADLPVDEQNTFFISGVIGVVTYILVDGLGAWIEATSDVSVKDQIHKAGLGLFVYLEVLDASFSFDGVVGSFAITNNLFIIMIGLSIGAFFVRSLTIMFVEQETLTHYAYLEHGAFYAIGSLAGIMLLDPFLHIPEWITGTLGAGIIIVSFLSSLKKKSLQG